MDSLPSTGDKTSNQDHLNFINKLNDSKIPRRSQLMANRLFMKNFPRETTSAEIEHCFQAFGIVHDVKIIAKENTHFAFISFVNENTAWDVLRQHAIAPLTFQSRPIILAPAYKKHSTASLTSPSSYDPATGSNITPPQTPSRASMPRASHQPSTPFQYQQQQPYATPHHQVYPSVYYPVHANMPFAPMPGTYMMPQGGTPTHHPQLPPSFYPTFYTQGGTHPSSAGQYIHGHAYMPSPYMYCMGPGSYPSTATTGDVSMTCDY